MINFSHPSKGFINQRKHECPYCGKVACHFDVRKKSFGINYVFSSKNPPSLKLRRAKGGDLICP